MHRQRFLLAPAFLFCASFSGGSEAAWPCYHGSNRDNLSADTGLLSAWPAKGPELLWASEGLGLGYSSVAVLGDRIYTAGMIGKTTHVTALDLSGRVVWQKPNGRSWEAAQWQRWAVPYRGSRGTPTADGNTVYHLSELGSLRAFDAKTGKERWFVDVLKTFSGKPPKYGLSESVFILGEALICCPGGEKGYMVALHKHTGRILWAMTALKDPVGYCSPVLARIGGVEHLITMSAERVFAVDPADGTLRWEFPFGNERGNSATDVVVRDGLVFASCGYGKGSVLLRPKRRSDGGFAVEQVWMTKLLDNHHGGVLCVGKHLYGAGHKARGWHCLELATGRLAWKAPGKGSLTYAEGKLYCLEERGTLSLVRCTPEKWDVISSFSVPRGGRGLWWAHPVVCGGRLYVRHGDKLFAYKIRAQ